MAAHAFCMGLRRPSGPVQGTTHRDEWHRLGYQVEGDFKVRGRPVTIRRAPDTDHHPADLDRGVASRAGSLLEVRAVSDQSAEACMIANSVAQDLAQGMAAEEILVTTVADGGSDGEFLEIVRDVLRLRHDIPAFLIGERDPEGHMNNEVFTVPDRVTLANIFRAKGNEAYKVYLARAHLVTRGVPDQPDDGDTEVRRRNQVSVGLTRSRLWCVVSGTDGPCIAELQDLARCLTPECSPGERPSLTFPAFGLSDIRRQHDDAP
jgi:superfamily I DNA and RNA helicase